ncbi:hypothetical protein [Rhodococcus tukisamuensis]|uniref:Uncharacterized protein n=1 Tax=Rhodococcus tukisamuensis TaxID=168276 RepID=A0A1G6WYS4_9NOCA|nr:hypothetical protein [Rhodococcus tukisamuensis]SDD71062.1 hypothetical protein SAMN05444580_10631 [Rhodococcus tukisamuensis]
MFESAIATALTLAALAAAPLAMSTATASATTTMPFQIPRVWGINIYGLCEPACVDYPVAVVGETDGVVTFPAPRPFAVPGAYAVHWKNISTGAAGTSAIDTFHPAVARTGPGVVTATVTTGDSLEYLSARGIFLVP